ncbi:MAG: cytochrome c-type biosis protein CcmF [Chloroflexota bacterium]|jgi:cytochrome c-type biogenesis protein CcmF|nr:cytochrome c-type biosis protein CcmF [Chloroflexota bacterium]
MTGADIGAAALLAALVAAVCACVAGVLGARMRDERLLMTARNGALATSAMIVLASLVLVAAFVNHDYSLAYVAAHSSRSMPIQFVIAAFYSGQQGSLLYWALTLSIFGAIVIYQSFDRLRQIIGYVVAVLMGIETFFLLILNFAESPFLRLPVPPPDGQGLNPLLYDGGMLFHPPMLLLGYSSVAIPFAFAMGALIAGRTDADWIRATRRYSLFAWAFLGIGNLLGAWWAYHVLGWGGYWGWDPVENSAIMPWLALTAYVHSVIVQQRRGMLKVWNMALIIATFCLAIQGTFIVRSGVISSVHSFAQSVIGPYFFAFLAIVVVGSVTILLARLPMLKDDQQFDGLVSRESGFLLNNVLLVGIAFATYWGTIFPVLSEAVRGVKATVGPPFYQQVNGPLLIGLLLLMGLGPLLPWRRATREQLRRSFVVPLAIAGVGTLVLVILGLREPAAVLALAGALFAAITVGWEYWRGVRSRLRSSGEPPWLALSRLVSRARPRYGGYLVHLGVAVIAVGVASSQLYQVQREVTLPRGGSFSVGRYTLTSLGLVETRIPGARVDTARLEVTEAGGPTWIAEPAKVFYENFNDQPATHVAIETRRLEDVYLVLSGWGDDGTVSVVATLNPMVSLIWFGGVVLLFGAAVSLWPDPVVAPRRARVAMPEALAAEA